MLYSNMISRNGHRVNEFSHKIKVSSNLTSPLSMKQNKQKPSRNRETLSRKSLAQCRQH